jgi:predicted cytidylate kinase
MGDLSRDLAEKKGMTIEEFNRWGETHPERDDLIDDYQKKLGKEQDGFVIDGRLSFYFIPDSVKIFIDADNNVRAQRRLQNPKSTESYGSLEEALRNVLERDDMDRKRYLAKYGIDPYDKSHYDLVIDSSDILPDKIVDRIVLFISDFCYPETATHIETTTHFLDHPRLP